MLGVRGHAQVIDARAEDAELEGPFEAELVRLRVPDEVEEGPEREAQDHRVAVPPRGRRWPDSMTAGADSSPMSAMARAARSERKDARLRVGDQRQRLAQEPFGIRAGQAEPP